MVGSRKAEPPARRNRGAKAGKPMRKKRRGMRPDYLELAASARLEGLRWYEVAALFREKHKLNGLVAMRSAHSLSQRDLAEEWNRRWPDDPKTFKSFSYWENWPARTGLCPSLRSLIRLAEIFQCRLPDLLEGYADFRHLDACYGVRPLVDEAPATQAMAVALEGVIVRLADAELDEVVAAGLTWAERLPPDTSARELLAKLSAGLDLAATQLTTPSTGMPANAAGEPADDLTGLWRLDGCNRPVGLSNDYAVVLRRNRGRMIGSSLPHQSGGRLRLDLHVEGRSLAGTWTMHQTGTAYGCARLHPDAELETLRGQWMGFDAGGRAFRSDAWVLQRMQNTLGGRAVVGLRATG